MTAWCRSFGFPGADHRILMRGILPAACSSAVRLMLLMTSIPSLSSSDLISVIWPSLMPVLTRAAFTAARGVEIPEQGHVLGLLAVAVAGSETAKAACPPTRGCLAGVPAVVPGDRFSGRQIASSARPSCPRGLHAQGGVGHAQDVFGLADDEVDGGGHAR